MKSLKKTIVTIIGLIILVIVLVTVAGMYKFNILQDDIYVEDENGEMVKYNDLSEEQKANQYNEDGLPERDSEATVYSYKCSDETSGSAVFGVIPNAILLTYKGQTETLSGTASASGAKYVNENESFVFHEKGGEAFIQINGELTHTGCVLELVENR